MNYANLVQKNPAIVQPARRPRVPGYLVKEEIDGVKFYYLGYQSVMDKTKQKEEIMGCSGLQSFIIDYLLGILYGSSIKKNHYFFTNEAGNTLARKVNLQIDIALYEQSKLPPEKVTRRYVRGVAPAIVFEIDLDVDLENTGIENMEEFVQLKTQKLLDYGTQKVFWIFTKSKKVFIADAQNQRIENWGNTLEIMDGVCFNIGQYLAEKKNQPGCGLISARCPIHRNRGLQYFGIEKPS